MSLTFVNAKSKVVLMLDGIEGQQVDPPTLYLDVQGINIAPHNSISLVVLFNLALDHIYFVDLFLLGAAAFNTPNKSGTTLRSVLESDKVPKVFFGLTTQRAAFKTHFNIALRNATDIQLLKAVRAPPNTYVTLDYCVEQDGQLPKRGLQDWKEARAKARKMFTGPVGSDVCFLNRDLAPDIVVYCIQNVAQLPILWHVYLRSYKGSQADFNKKLREDRAASLRKHKRNCSVLTSITERTEDGDEDEDEEEKEEKSSSKPTSPPNLISGDNGDVYSNDDDNEDGGVSLKDFTALLVDTNVSPKKTRKEEEDDRARMPPPPPPIPWSVKHPRRRRATVDAEIFSTVVFEPTDRNKSKGKGKGKAPIIPTSKTPQGD